MKKTGLILLGMALSIAFVFASPKAVKAEYMPCTYATIAEATAQKAYYSQEYAKALLDQQAAEAQFQLALASGNQGQIAYADLVRSQAASISRGMLDQVNNAQLFIDNATKRGKVEEYYLNMMDKWQNRVLVDQYQREALNAQEAANLALNNVNNIKNAIASINQLTGAANASSQMSATLAAAEAEYAVKQAIADNAKAAANTAVNTLNFATNADNDAYGEFARGYGKDPDDDLEDATEEDIHWFD